MPARVRRISSYTDGRIFSASSRPMMRTRPGSVERTREPAVARDRSRGRRARSRCRSRSVRRSTLSDAVRIAAGSPRSRASSCSAPIICVSTPRRRCVGCTPTHDTAAAGTVAPPGSVSSNEYARLAPTIAPSSNATRVRSSSPSAQLRGSSGRGGPAPKARWSATIRSSTSSGPIARISIAMDPGLAAGSRSREAFSLDARRRRHRGGRAGRFGAANRADVREAAEEQDQRDEEDAGAAAAEEQHRERDRRAPRRSGSASRSARTRGPARRRHRRAATGCRRRGGRARRSRRPPPRRTRVRGDRTTRAANSNGIAGATSEPARIHSSRTRLRSNGAMTVPSRVAERARDEHQPVHPRRLALAS